MSEFVKPLRRKIGVLTLAAACVFAAIWVRSPITFDELLSPYARCISSNGGLYFEVSLQEFGLGYHYNSMGPNVKGRPDFYNDRKMISFWRWRSFGFAYRSEDYDIDDGRAPSKVTVNYFMIPFWSIVLPLTLLSAWLLLSKPRVKTSRLPTEIAA